ncbi:MAG: RHS repeat-associated core domain-containing protein [Cytophagales bacterium]|nr:RHS repeat-associated core domain-containing protein [Cytophagales bacterium]
MTTTKLKKYFVTILAIVSTLTQAFSQDEALVQTSSESLSLQSTNLGFLQNSVNLFTGEVAFPLNLVSASAPGGIPVNVSMGYNTTGLSSASDVWNREAPTSTVGWGWSFGFPQIIVDHKLTGTREDDDFFLSEGGLNALIYTGTQSYFSEDKQSSYTAEVYRTKNHMPYSIYFIPSLERWEIKRDGMTYIYGGKNDYPTAVQWVVKWGNWIGNSANTTNQSRQGLVWNLAKVHDQWGNDVEYTYQNVENRVSAVSGTGQYHTEASYLDEITLSDGVIIDLVYTDKSTWEFYEPHTEKSEPDAYQERYEKKFLDEVQVFNEFGNLIEKIDLRYNVLNFDGTQHYDTRKRVLTEVESYNIEGHASDPIKFSYISSGTNASKLQTVTSPTGATTSFTYGSVVLSEGDLNISVDPPAGGGFTEHRIWSTPNYTVIAWYNPSSDTAIIELHYWDGAWEKKELFDITNLTGQDVAPRGIGWNVFQFDDPFQIELKADHFAMIGPSSQSNHHYLYRAYLDYSTNQWKHQKHHLDVGSGTPTLLAGDKFAGLLTKSSGQLKLYKRTTSGWAYDNIGLPVTGTFFGTATNNFIFAHDEDGDPDNLWFFYLDKENVFQQSTVPSGIRFAGNSFSSWHSSNSFAYVAASQNPEYVYQWDENYGNFQRKQILALNGDDIEFHSLNNNLFFMRDYDDNDQDYRIGRYDGNNWKVRDFSKGVQSYPPVLNEDFYIIDDLNYFYSYNPNTSTWTQVNVSGLPASRFFNLQNGFSTYRSNGSATGETYIRNANGTFTALSGSTTSIKTGGTNYGVNGIGEVYFREGNHVNTSSISITSPDIISQYELSQFGATSFAFYDDNQIHLWRIIDQQVEGNITAHPVIRVTSFDGFQNTYTSFDYEGSSARVDAAGTANFKKVSTIPGSSSTSSKPFGHVDTQFFNGQDITGANFGTENLYHAILKGSPYQVSNYNSSGVLVSEAKTGYTTMVRSQLGYSNFPLFTRVNRTDEKLHGVTKSTYFTYNIEGQLKETEYFNIDSKGNSDRVESFNTYFWEVYDLDLSEGIASPVVQTESRLNGTTASSNVSRWKQWSGDWAPSSSFTWEGGSSTFPDWQTTNSPSDWLLTGTIVQRDGLGSVIEEEDIYEKRTTHIYGYNRNLPMGSVYNASPNEVFYEDFGNGQNNLWSGTAFSNGLLSFSGGTKKAFPSNALLNPTSFIADFKIRVFGTGYNSFKFNASSVDPSENEGFSLRIEENGVIRLFKASTQVGTYTFNVGFNDWHSIRIKRSSNEISAYVDGEEVITYTASSSDPSGSFHGFYGNGTESTVDHFRVYPADAYATTSGYDDETKTMIEALDEDGMMVKTLSNAWQNPIVNVDPDNRIISSQHGGSSVKIGGSFDASNPSRVMSVRPRGLESLADDFSYERDQWTEYSHAASSWNLIDNRLVHTNSNTTSSNSGYYYNFGQELTGEVSIEFDVWVEEEKSWLDNFGFAAGGSSWNRTIDGSESALWLAFSGDDLITNTGTWDTLNVDMDIEGYLHRIRIVADTYTDEADYYLDGRYLGTLPFRSTTSGIQQIGFRNYGSTVASTWYIDNLAVYTNGVESVSFFDATGKSTQTMSRASNGHVLISETGYDALSRPIYQTKPTRNNVSLSYRPGFVTNFNATTGILTGEISSLNGNQQHLYASTSYEASPLGRTFKNGIPGSDYSVWGGTKTTSRTYSSNAPITSSDFYMGPGYTTSEYHAVRVEDPEQGKVISFYDKSGSLVLTKQGKVDMVDASGNVVHDFLYTKYHYQDGTRTAEVAPPNNHQMPTLPADGSTPPADAYSTIRKFDVSGRLTEESTPDGGTMYYIYDEIGRVKFIKTGSNDIKYFRYNSFGQLTEEGLWATNWSSLAGTTTIPSSIATWRVKYTYDGLNNLIETAYNSDASSDIESKETYTYDKYDRVTTVSLYVYDYSTIPHVVSYTYDHSGNLIDESYDGFTIRTTYFDTNGLLKSIGTPGNTDRYAAYSFDGFGNLYQEKLDDQGVTTTFSYDIRDWLTSIDNAYFREDLNYSSGGYNNAGFYNGLIASTAYTFKSGLWSGASRPSNYTYEYDYDKMGRLTSANHTSDNTYDVGIGANKEIRYDANGNIKSYFRGSQPHTYEYTFGTNKVINTDNDGSNNFQYDGNGNVKGMLPKGFADIDYDPYDNQVIKLDRLPNGLQLGANDVFVSDDLSLTSSGGKNYVRQAGVKITLEKGFQATQGFEASRVIPDYETSFQYGPGGERVYKRDQELNGSSDIKTIYIRGLNDYPIAIRTKDQLGNESVVRFINGSSGLIATKETGGDYFVLKDHLGSSRIVLQDNGTVSSTYNYLPMGGLMNSTVSENNPYRFQGQEYDAETGLHNFRARFYDDELGRFFGMDPQNQFASPYVGIGNNAVNFVDPDGEWAHLAIAAGIGGAVNLTHNALQGNLAGGNIWETIGRGAAAYGAGAAAGALSTLGPAGWGYGGAIVGGTNAWLSGAQGAEIAVASFHGVGSGVVGGAVGSATSAGATSLVGSGGGFIDGFARGAISGGAAGGVNAAISGQQIGKGIWQGAALGGAIGGTYTGIEAHRNGARFFSGKRTFDISNGIGAHNIKVGTASILDAKYRGKFEGVKIFESRELGTFRDSKNHWSGGVTLPGKGIIVGQGVFSKNFDIQLMQHEFGHILQAKRLGNARFYAHIGKASLLSAAFNHSHNTYWTETWANYLSQQYFGSNYSPTPRFPVKNIGLLRLILLSTSAWGEGSY